MEDSELLKAKVKDQKAIASQNQEKIKKIFRKNTNLLKKFIEEQGWPSKEKYGEEVSSAAWLIAQHSDHDPNFQLQCFALIFSNFSGDKESMKDIAYLLDRTLVNKGQKQVFGTQLNKDFSMPETISPKELNTIRKRFGLEPIKDYIKRVKEFTDKQEA